MTHTVFYDDATGLQPLNPLFTKEKASIGSVHERTVYVRNTGGFELDVKVGVSGAHKDEVKIEGGAVKLKAGDVAPVKVTWIPSEPFKDEHFNARLTIDEEYVV